MSESSRTRRDTGSRTFGEVVRHPLATLKALFRPPALPPAEDLAGARSPEGIVVSCFLQASFGPFPRRWKQGGLFLSENGARWGPGIRAKKIEAIGKSEDSWVLPTPFQSVAPVKSKPWEKFGVLRNPAFMRIAAKDTQGDVSLAVARDSVALVVERLANGAGA